MSRPVPTAQEYVPGTSGRRLPVHTPALKDACRCYTCRNRRWQTPERRAEMSERMRRQYADGSRARQHDMNEKRAEHWRAEEDALLRALAPHHDCLTIGRLLGERLGHPRSESAVKHRCKILGIARMAVRPFTASEVGRIFGGVSRETVRTRFVLTGLLVGTVRRGGPHGMRMFTRGDLERLIREHPEAYDVEAIRDPGLRALAQAATRGRRPLPTPEVTRLTGVGQRQLAAWYARGLVPSARKVTGVRQGAGGGWLIDAGDVETVRRLAREQADRRRRRADACSAGHPRTAENTYVEASTGRSRCRLCRRARSVSSRPPSFSLRMIDRADAERRRAS